ncbi:MAG: sigma-70 family RNA polymerase sigma factor, partial [Gemmatimonadota bacterium]
MEPQPDRANDSEDRALIERWLRGDQRAATAIVDRHANAIARFVGTLGEQERDEVVQDTFVRAFSSFDSFRGESSLRTWLFTIARRLVLDRRRAQRRRPEAESLENVEVAEGGFTALDAIVAAESEGQVREAVGRLSPTQREVFTLRVGEGLSYKEIAEVVRTTEGAAR